MSGNMAFEHVSTFLRSALARDPFCHGGIITPEDVLRIEAKFPTLFDKPAPPPTPTKAANPEKSNAVEEPTQGNVPAQKNKVASKKNSRVSSNQVKKAAAHTTVARKKRVQGTTPTQATAAVQKIKPSQYHKKCTEKAEEDTRLGQSKKAMVRVPVKTTSQTKGKVIGSAGRRLIRPAQSFSMEDLRATLRQVMKEDVLEQKWFKDKRFKKSPYSEDLVKKFLGWKLAQEEQKCRVKQYGIEGKVKSQDESALKMKALTDVIVAYNEPGPSGSEKRRKEKLVPRVKSAPGFLRGPPDLPPVPNYQKKRTMLSMASKGDESARKGECLGAGDGDIRERHMKWDDVADYYDEDVDEQGEYKEEGNNLRRQMGQECLKIKDGDSGTILKPKRSDPGSRRNDTQMHFRSNKALPEQDEAASFLNKVEGYKMKSSYKDLLAARSEKTRYEVKGFLRKQEVSHNLYEQELERERMARRTRRGEASSSELPENFSRRMTEIGERSNQETKEALRKMAEELVYTEILHQINEYKREQEEIERENRKELLLKLSPSTSPSPRQKSSNSKVKFSPKITLPEFVPTSPEKEENESNNQGEEKTPVSEIVLKTPELTPPSVNKRVVDKTKKNSPRTEGSKDMISLHTPELSPSPKRLIAAIKERRELQKKLIESPPQQNQQLDTDCSEMSDFIFSEVSRKEEKHSNNKIPTVPEEESAKLDTPQLTDNQQELEKTENPSQEKSEAPEKDGSTLSGVPSPFPDTPSISRDPSQVQEEQKEAPEIDAENSQKSSARYSDDFTPEKENSLKEDNLPQATSTPMIGTPSQKSSRVSEIFSDDTFISDADEANESGETVIDILSEGEFIGASYRSPGELSWRRQAGRPSSTVRFLNPPLRTVQSSSFEQQQSTIVSSTSAEEGSNDGISVVSPGALVAPENVQPNKHASVGEYLNS